MPRLPRWPSAATPVSLLGVDYVHLPTHDGGDLYLTRFGAPFWPQLQPENWLAKEWFETKRKRLIGTSTVYHLPTKKIDGASLQLLVKWSRVGEDVPLGGLNNQTFFHAEFNSPFEEFSLLMELRSGVYGPPGFRIRTQKPLAIYVPPEKLQLWQTGRSQSKIAAKTARSPGVELDILRQYVLLYGWVKGLDLIQTANLHKMNDREQSDFLAGHTSMVIHELERKGYRVIDMKPAHVIVRPRSDGTLLRDSHGQIAYVLIDYELLERTPEHEEVVRSGHRQHYLDHMARRFEAVTDKPLPPHLRSASLLGVDYLVGRAESTGGLLWVVGKDPDLFNYFLPERWRRTPNVQLTPSNQVFHTCTKDNVNLVWRISRVGEKPKPTKSLDPAAQAAIIEYGYNSPFEEFAFALALAKAGIKTTYPRAIYMTGRPLHLPGRITDARRHKAMANIRTPDGHPAMSQDHDYITLWGFWNGPDELLAAHDGQYYQCVNLQAACANGVLPEKMGLALLEDCRLALGRCGFEHLELLPEHVLVSIAPDGTIVADDQGKPEGRLCNFELARPLPQRVPGL